jgi:hypothetical protein
MPGAEARDWGTTPGTAREKATIIYHFGVGETVVDESSEGTKDENGGTWLA